MRAEPRTIIFFSDVGCPWASLAVHRLRQRRDALGLDVAVDHRAFPLELINERPTPKRTLDAEVAVIGAHEPALGWQPWRRPDSEYPGTTLLALEAVQAAKAQRLRASEDLDAALRTAFYAQGRAISIYAQVMGVAGEVASLDPDTLGAGLRRGAGRAEVFEQWGVSARVAQGSPHLFLPDGSDVHNPGIQMEWTGEKGRGFPRIVRDDPSVYDDVLRRAAG